MSIVIDLTFDDRNKTFRELASSPVDDVVKRFGYDSADYLTCRYRRVLSCTVV
jgi:hypothetical protein